MSGGQGCCAAKSGDIEARKTALQISKTRDGLQVVIAIGRNERAATSWLSVATLTPRSGGSPRKVE